MSMKSKYASFSSDSFFGKPLKAMVLHMSYFWMTLSRKNVFNFNRCIFEKVRRLSVDDIKANTLIGS